MKPIWIISALLAVATAQTDEATDPEDPSEDNAVDSAEKLFTDVPISFQGWNYRRNGADWSSIEGSQCGSGAQSPIDLEFDRRSFKYDSDKQLTLISSDDQTQIDFHDLKSESKAIKVKWVGNYTSEISLAVEDDSDIKIKDKGNSESARGDDDDDEPTYPSEAEEEAIVHTFKSMLPSLAYDMNVTEFQAHSIHFKAGSEHTIDGERFDLEMQVFFKAKAEEKEEESSEEAAGSEEPSAEDPSEEGEEAAATEPGAGEDAAAESTGSDDPGDGAEDPAAEEEESGDDASGDFKMAAISILFTASPDRATANLAGSQVATINNFFKDLSWSDTSDEASTGALNLNSLFKTMDMSKRWAYNGSLTEPPCTTGVYWNVLSTIYPIQEKYVTQFVSNQLSRATEMVLNHVDPKNGKQRLGHTEVSLQLSETGNWRMVQADSSQHNVRYLSAMRMGGLAAAIGTLLWTSAL